MYCCYRFCCTIVTIFVVLLLPLLLHCDYRFCCISNFLLQEMAEKYFSIDTVIAEHMKVYENLLKD